MDTERRRYIRFLARDNIFAALRTEFKKVGRVNDISIKGLSFSYLKKDLEAVSDRDLSQVDIFLSEDEGFHLSKVPCRMVYDILEPSAGISHRIVMYRCGLRFGKLIKSQMEELIFFIENHTTRPSNVLIDIECSM